MDRIVKGIILADYVRMIRNAKSVNWDKYLTREDKNYLNQRILESEWYPFDTLDRMAVGIITELAKGDLETVKAWGRVSMERISELNKSILCEDQPMESLMRFKIFRGSLFNFDPIKVVLITSKKVIIELNYGMSEIAEKAAAYHTLGYIERLLELAGAKQIRSEFTSKIWGNDPATVYEVEWSEAPLVKKVRGTIFVDYVRMIKSRKEIDWSEHLLPDDMVYLHRKIRNDEWYPFSTFERMGLAIINTIARGDFDAVRKWGQFLTRKLVEIHESLLRKNDPMETIMRFQILRGSFFDFDPIHIQNISPFYVKFEMNFGMSEIAEKAATYQLLGYLEILLDLAGAKDVKYEFSKMKWENSPYTILEMFWK